MPDTHDLGKFFWHRIRLRTDAPRHHRFETQEYEYPYRHANSHILRLSRSFGVVIGWWRGGDLEEESGEYEDHLSASLQAHTHQTNEECYKPIADIRYTLVPAEGRRRMAEVDA